MKKQARVFKQRNIGVVGLGLIGASIAKRLVESDKSLNVVGVDTSEATLKYAFEHEIIHLGLSDLRILKGCEVIFVAVPVALTSRIIADVFQVVGSSAVITDVGSVKQCIASALPNGVRYVGGHPMAGKAECGIEASYPHLFENAYYALTLEQGQSQQDLDLVREMVALLGAIPLVMTAQQHDEVVAKISHLPHALAFSLVNYAINCKETELLAATGFKDMTRIASSGAELWTNAFSLNKTAVVQAIDGVVAELAELRENIQSGEVDSITAKIDRANQLRQGLNILKGERSSVNVDVKDKAGSIARVAKILARGGVSIKNIRIVGAREQEGALTLEFASENDSERARELLRKKGYRLY